MTSISEFWYYEKNVVGIRGTNEVLNEMLRDKVPAKVARVTRAFLKMKKLNITPLKKAYKGKR